MRALLEFAIRWLSKRPRWKYQCLQMLRHFPWMRKRLEAFANARGYGGIEQARADKRWNIDAPKGSVAKWDGLLQGLKAGKR